MTDTFRGVIFDIDGVLEFQGKVYPGAVELLDFLRKNGVVIRILSNSTLKSRRSCTEKLNKQGFNVNEEEVVTASFATAQYLEMQKPKSCWVMLKGEGLEEFKGFHHNSENPEYIVLGDYRENFNFKNINRAVKLLLNGSKLIVMITEVVDNSMGEVEITVGAYGKMLENAANIEAVYIGKPNRYIFETVLETMSIKKNEILMVGDKISTDILGANNAGIKSALIKTGEFRKTDLEGKVQPDFIFDSISDIEKLFYLFK